MFVLLFQDDINIGKSIKYRTINIQGKISYLARFALYKPHREEHRILHTWTTTVQINLHFGDFVIRCLEWYFGYPRYASEFCFDSEFKLLPNWKPVGEFPGTMIIYAGTTMQVMTHPIRVNIHFCRGNSYPCHFYLLVMSYHFWPFHTQLCHFVPMCNCSFVRNCIHLVAKGPNKWERNDQHNTKWFGYETTLGMKWTATRIGNVC